MNEDGAGRLIMDKERFSLTIERLAQTLMEEFEPFENICFVAIQPRGVILAKRLVQRISVEPGMNTPLLGVLDITFYRDDFRRRDKPIEANFTDMPFLIEGKKVILVDDVLYTGRTTQAALTALNHFGRPSEVTLLVMVNRRFNRHLPIQSTFTGIQVDALDKAYVQVTWEEESGEDKILLFADKQEIKH
jgi:pyrimidine operon attenuation protein/uracil phosphoribosyltransferase